MMNIISQEIQIPVYCGGWIDVFWNCGGVLAVEKDECTLILHANSPALEALAKQMLYFSCNNSLDHAHVHYDDFFCANGYSGESLILEFCADEEIMGSELYDSESISLHLDILCDCADYSVQCVPGLFQVSLTDCQIVCDEKAMIFIAKTILALNHRKMGGVMLTGFSDSGKKPALSILYTDLI